MFSLICKNIYCIYIKLNTNCTTIFSGSQFQSFMLVEKKYLFMLKYHIFIYYSDTTLVSQWDTNSHYTSAKLLCKICFQV